MTREHLFRGQSVGDLAPWIYGYFHYDKTIPAWYICDKDTLVRFEVKKETVGQSMGWKDEKTGQPVFEGDWYFDKAMNLHVVVEWDEDDAAFKLAGYGWNEDDSSPSETPECITYDNFASILAFEVQGNIWDNPIPGLNSNTQIKEDNE